LEITFYMSGARQRLGAPVTLFPLTGVRRWADFDASVDGTRFLASVPETSGDLQPLTAVVNWTSEVRKRR